MNMTTIRNKLITYKNYEPLELDLVKEIQDNLLKTRKLSDFEILLKKVENQIRLNRKQRTQRYI